LYIAGSKGVQLLLKKTVNIDDIVQGCQANQPKYQRILYEQFAGKLMGICVRYCRNEELAKDALQETFVKIFNNISSFKSESKIETWMTRIAINTTLNHLRQGKRYQFIDDNEQVAHSIENQYAIGSDSIEKLSHDELINILQELPDGYRVVFNMYAVEGYTHKEIADELGINEGTSKSQLNRARKHLQNLVQEKMGIYSSVKR